MNEIYAWHFVKNNYRTSEGDIEVFSGQKLHVDGPVELCYWGLHASKKAIDALQYAPGSIVCRVKLHGDTVVGDDKLCATDRTVLWVADATRVLQEFAIWCAEQAIDLLISKNIEVDPRSIDAIKVARLWLNGNTSQLEMNAAAAHAVYAADAAAHAAAHAVYAAAHAAHAVYAAAHAADAAAHAAAHAADAAYANIVNAQNKKLEEMLFALSVNSNESEK